MEKVRKRQAFDKTASNAEEQAWYNVVADRGLSITIGAIGLPRKVDILNTDRRANCGINNTDYGTV